MKPKILTFLFCSAVAAASVNAQSISFNPFASAPLSLNPAFTGLFDGKLRANALYRNQWNSIAVPYISAAASVDMGVLSNKDSYWAAGITVFRGIAGDGGLNSFTGLASVAFHKTLRNNMHVGVGVQGGYDQTSFNLSKLYFNSPGNTVPLGINPQIPGGGIATNSYLINTGASFSHDVSKRLSYMVAVSAHNIYQPPSPKERSQWEDAGNARNYNASLSADWLVVDRFSIRPSFLYQVNTFRNRMIGGSEFHFNIQKSKLKNTVFAGIWYRTSEMATIMSGVEIRSFRASLGYDYYISSLNSSSNGNGGIEVAVRYILPQK